MRCLVKNKQKIYYSLYLGETEITDSDGNLTGEKTATRSTPVGVEMNVSPNAGKSALEAFGTLTPYNRVLITDNMTCPIDEETVLWIGISPTGANNTSIPFNFTVEKVARSLNSIAILAKEVTNE